MPSERPGAGDFQRMHEPVVNMVVHGEGVGLRFPGQHAERVGKEDAVVVLYEGAAGDVENDMGRSMWLCRTGESSLVHWFLRFSVPFPFMGSFPFRDDDTFIMFQNGDGFKRNRAVSCVLPVGSSGVREQPGRGSDGGGFVAAVFVCGFHKAQCMSPGFGGRGRGLVGHPVRGDRYCRAGRKKNAGGRGVFRILPVSSGGDVFWVRDFVRRGWGCRCVAGDRTRYIGPLAGGRRFMR